MPTRKLKPVVTERPITAAQFARMSRAKQRRAIAQDVLARLRARQLHPTPHVFVRMDPDDAIVKGRETRDLQRLLKEQRECEVCALGGAICGLAHFEDRVRIHESAFRRLLRVDINPANYHKDNPYYEGDKRLDKRLDEIFGKEQLAMMEFAFEGGEGAFDDEGIIDLLGPEVHEKLIEFYHRFDSHRDAVRDRFRAIWRKVANHPQGRFVI